MRGSKKLTILEYQVLVKKLVHERGFDGETAEQVLILLVEEVGELAKVLRKVSGVKIDKTRRQYDVAEEAADVFWMLVDLCNRLDIDLAKAFADKEKKNQKRVWTEEKS